MPPQLPPEVIGIIVHHSQPRHSVLSSEIQLEREDVYRRLSQISHVWRAYANHEADYYLIIRMNEKREHEFGSRKAKYLSITSRKEDFLYYDSCRDYFLRNEEANPMESPLLTVLRSVKNTLEEAHISTYVNFEALVLLMRCTSLHSLHMRGVEGHWNTIESLCLKHQIGLKFNLFFHNLHHISICDETATNLLQYLMHIDVCPSLVSVNLKVCGMYDCFLKFPAGQGSRIQFLSIRAKCDALNAPEDDPSAWEEQIEDLTDLLGSLTNLQHFAYCGCLDFELVLNQIPSPLQTLVTTLQELRSLKDVESVKEVLPSIVSARILAPLPRPRGVKADRLVQSAANWTKEENLSLELISLERYDSCDIILHSYNSDTVEGEQIRTLSELQELRKMHDEEIARWIETDEEGYSEVCAAEDWYECWEQFRMQELKF